HRRRARGTGRPRSAHQRQRLPATLRPLRHPWEAAALGLAAPSWRHRLAQLLRGPLVRLRGRAAMSDTVEPQGKGYRRIDFEEAWSSYCPDQTSSHIDSDISIRPTVPRPVESAQVDGFASVPEAPWDGSKNGNLSNNHAGWDARTLNEPQNGARNGSATTGTP